MRPDTGERAAGGMADDNGRSIAMDPQTGQIPSMRVEPIPGPLLPAAQVLDRGAMPHMATAHSCLPPV